MRLNFLSDLKNMLNLFRDPKFLAANLSKWIDKLKEDTEAQIQFTSIIISCLENEPKCKDNLEWLSMVILNVIREYEASKQ